MNLEQKRSLHPVGRGSWLSLVAETAGVPGATIARVELFLSENISRDKSSLGRASAPLRAIVQVHDAEGRVVGATYWHGDATDLARGVPVDLGCDLNSTWGARVVAWLDDETVCGPSQAVAPDHVSEKSFDPFSAMKLMLRGSSNIRPMSPAEAA